MYHCNNKLVEGFKTYLSDKRKNNLIIHKVLISSIGCKQIFNFMSMIRKIIIKKRWIIYYSLKKTKAFKRTLSFPYKRVKILSIWKRNKTYQLKIKSMCHCLRKPDARNIFSLFSKIFLPINSLTYLIWDVSN